jgi:hypothetical protein
VVPSGFEQVEASSKAWAQELGAEGGSDVPPVIETPPAALPPDELVPASAGAAPPVPGAPALVAPP